MSASENGIASSLRREIAGFATDFVHDVLVGADWFVALNTPSPRWDVLFVGGSTKYGLGDPKSDLDLFLVMPRAVQRESGVRPVYSYSYRDRPVEVSQLSTEQMIAACDDKRYLFHWHAGILVEATSDQAGDAWRAAGALSARQLRQIAWTAFAEFMILRDSVDASPAAYEDPLSTRLNVADVVRSFTYVLLLIDGRCHTIKWLSRELLRTHSDIHETVSQLISAGTLSESFFRVLRGLWEELLIRLDLPIDSDDQWAESHLDLLLFQ